MRAVADGAGGPGRQRKLAAILCADIAGFSRLMGEDEAGTYDGLARLRGAVDPIIAQHGGRIVSTAGDGLLADFPSVVDALGCGVAIQDIARAQNEGVPPEKRLELRIGVNLGDVIVAEDGDLYGDGVNIAARLQVLAEPGGIFLSQTVYDQVGNKLDLAYRCLGRHRVKNIAQPVTVYAVGGDRRPWQVVPRRTALFVIAALVLVNAGLLVWLFAGHGGGQTGLAEAAPVATLAVPARLAERTSVAVLPFKNLSPDSEQDFLSDGIAEDIINALGRFSNLLVAAKSASLQFKGRNVAPEEAGRQLGARYLVEGSVRRAGDRLRITVELTEAATGVHLWSEVYNAEMKDLFSVQDDITNRIVGAAAVRLTRIERERAERKPTANLTAYEYILRGRADLSSPSRKANSDARDSFQRAIDLDPNYALAYASLGMAHQEAVVAGWTEFPADDLARAEALAKKALALDPATTKAYVLLAQIGMYRKEWDRALVSIDQGLAINPSDAECYQVRAAILSWSGQPGEAARWLDAAQRFGELNTVGYMNLGISRYQLGEYGESLVAFDRMLARDAGRMQRLMAHPIRAAAYARLGKQIEVLRERAIIERMSPFFDAERFAAQFGTQEARAAVLAGLREAGFR